MGLVEVGERYGFGECLRRCRESRKMVLLIVAIALLLDNMLLSTVGEYHPIISGFLEFPIIPQFLFDLRHKNDPAYSGKKNLLNTTGQQLGRANTENPLFLSNLNGTLGEQGLPCSLPAKLQHMCINLTSAPETTTSPNYDNEPTTLSSSQEAKRHRDLIDENAEVGILFSSKAMVQVITNPFVGPLTNSCKDFTGIVLGCLEVFSASHSCSRSIGYWWSLKRTKQTNQEEVFPEKDRAPKIDICSVFAFGQNYEVLFIARAIQGMGSSCSSVAGMGMLADRYPDDQERGNAMAIALGGLALGVLIGPTFGSVMYEFVGKSSPFLVLAGVALFDGILQLIVLQPTVQRQNQQGASIFTLIKDPYILIAAGSIAFANMGIAALEPSLPLWMMDTMHSPKWQLGAAFLPASISYLIGTNIFGPLAYRMGRWRAGLIGLLIIGVCLIGVPFAKNIYHLILPNAGLGFAIGMVDSSMMPTLGNLVDLRHVAVYGSVYAIGDASFCVGYVLGPIFSSTILKTLGFGGMLTGIAMICFLYSPLMFYLKNPPTKAENKSLILNDSKVKYQSYHNEEEEE
ncbi:Synaptic vesicular amine transporter [Nymphon striatum]|nr:Synaptic vesicular amine transporter [Nymphon striatum]